MKASVRLLLLVAVLVVSAARAQDALDRLATTLTWADREARLRAHVSGLLDLEGYALPDPAPGVIDAEGRYLFNPRFTLGLDAQLGPQLYLFAQARADRGFDPAPDPIEVRLDEYALRWTPAGLGSLNIQIGKFATVVGSWTTRHDSWTNPFITAPLPYENLTGVWDNEPPHSVGQLLTWSHVRPGLAPAVAAEEKYLRIPILWGPSYTTGVAVAGAIDRFRYAFELKNASLSSRPDVWNLRDARWDHPTVSGRLRYVPDPSWEFGWSASVGSFLRPEAASLLPAGADRGDYREIVLGQDITYAWHHLQVWAEVYAARFHLPRIGNADTLAYYVEGKYKFAPQWFGSLRWNQQLFGRLQDRAGSQPWGRDTWRADAALAYRVTAHLQVKGQYSVQWGEPERAASHLFALQATLRF